MPLRRPTKVALALLLAALGVAASTCAACGSSNAVPPGVPRESGAPEDGHAETDATNDAAPPADGGAGDGALAACGDASAPWTDPGVAAPVADPALVGKSHAFDKITVVDQDGAPVVGAALTLTSSAVYRTDVHGNVAFYEPGLMDKTVWFGLACSGYTYPADGLGNAGAKLAITEGGSQTLTMTRAGAVTAPDAGDLQTRLLAGPVPGAAECFAIRVVDSVTARGVPLVQLAPAEGDPLWSDSQGMVAYCDPDHVGKSVTFTIMSDGYHLATGTSLPLATVAGGSQTVQMVRENPGERLYRVTGQGIYRDSVRLGLTTPVANPDINGLVTGQDTPSTFVYGGKLWWLWQDTNSLAYALGNFDTSGAVSSLPGDGGLSPDLGANQVYFVDPTGFSRGMVDLTGDPKNTSTSSLAVWLGGIAEVADADGGTAVYGSYYINTSATPWTALAKLDPATSTFDYVADYPAGVTLGVGRSTRVKDASGQAYDYWNNPVRFPATAGGVTDFAAYEVFSAYGPNGSTTLSTNADGTLAYAWTAGAAPVTASELQAAKIDPAQGLDGHVTDIVTGAGVTIAAQSAIWNDYRKRYGDIIQQDFGSTSLLGEIWYAEGDTPFGPWVFARKVVTHAEYTFYNPDAIPYFSEAGGRIVFFDATYTKTFTSLPATPYYDYNEIMYRLDLDDPRLVLPVAVYTRAAAPAQDLATKRGVRPGDLPLAASFYAYDRAATGAVPVAWSTAACGPRRLTVGGAPATTPLFYALPPGSGGDAGGDAGAAPATVPLYEYSGPNGAYAYSANPAFAANGFVRGAAIASVWPSPVEVALPIADFLGDLVADAGPDQCVNAGAAGTARVTLDGSASRDLAGPITRYEWKYAATGCVLATGVTAAVDLPPGVNDVLLETSDAAGNVSDDEVVIAVGT